VHDVAVREENIDTGVGGSSRENLGVTVDDVGAGSGIDDSVADGVWWYGSKI
jgi:hypothetical protein